MPSQPPAMPQAARPQMGLGEWALLILLAAVWGGSFFFVAVAVKEFPPLTVVLLRVALAALTLHVLVRLFRVALPRAPQIWGALFVMGFVNNAVPFTLIVWGQTHIGAGLASIINATTPLFTVLVAHVATSDEKLSPGRLAGIGCGLAGVVVMIGPDALAGLGGDVFGQIAILGAALSYGIAAVYGRRFKRMGVAPMATATGQVTCSTLILLPLALAVDQPWTLAMPSWQAWGAVLGLSVVATALAYLMFFRLLASAGATNISLVTLLVPVSAILLGALVLGERLGAAEFGGLALIALGLAAIDGRPIGWLRRGRATTSPR